MMWCRGGGEGPVDGVGGVRIDDAACGDKSSGGKRGADSAAVGNSPRAVFVFVRNRVREAQIVFAVARGADAGGDAWRGGVCDLRCDAGARDSGERAGLLPRAIHGLLLLPRGVGGTAAERQVPYIVLSHRGAGR